MLRPGGSPPSYNGKGPYITWRFLTSNGFLHPDCVHVQLISYLENSNSRPLKECINMPVNENCRHSHIGLSFRLLIGAMVSAIEEWIM